MKKTILILILLVLGVIVGVGGVLFDLHQYAQTPAAESGEERVVTIGAGDTFAATARRLHDGGIIREPSKFSRYARMKGYDKSIKAGEYKVSAAMAPEEILDIMVRGRVNLYRVTIPEGYNLYQIADLVSKAGISDRAAFVQAATDPALARQFGIEGDTFEGYLFPDTYYFPTKQEPEEIINTMVGRFRAVFNDRWLQRARDLELSVHQIVTLASIIEKETGAEFERPMISSVFHNRLKRRMRLESDPTVIYGISEFDGNLTRRHLTTPTPYNTYTQRGLPPGPIANPGKASLDAALFPSETDFIFFVSKRDNTHQFSTNIKDHNRAVRKYQLRR